jgi:hypothetical protein
MVEIALENSSAAVDLALTPGRELTGTVEPAGAVGRAVRLESAASTRGWGPARTVPVAADGAFQIVRIPPDRYRVLLLPQKSDEYIAVKLDDAAAAHQTVDLRRGGSKLKVTEAKAGAITGAADNHSRAFVFLFPDGEYTLEAMQLRDTPSDGAFRFERLEPGKYRLFAQDPLAGSKAGADFKVAAAAADVVEVKAGETTAWNAKVSDAKK